MNLRDSANRLENDVIIFVRIYTGKTSNMLQTVEAEIDVNGEIKLLEPVRVTKKSRAIVTVLNNEPNETIEKGNSKKISEFLRSPEFVNRKSYSAEEIEAQIKEARNSWE